MSNEDAAQSGKRQIAAAIGAALVTFAEQRTEGIRTRIGIPVERSGSTVIRSLPGEPPRRDSFDESGLWESVQVTEPFYGEEVGQGSVSITIFTDQKKAEWLEFGVEKTNLAARPWWEPSMEEIGDHLDDLKALFSENLETMPMALA